MLDISYNSTRAAIKLPEYGRSVQEMIQIAKAIPEPRLRQKTVETIVGLMALLNPNNKNQEDYREKLWNHAFRIANYELDVTPPPGIVIRRDADMIRPEKVIYPPITKRFRHYGYNIQTLIQKAIEMPDGPKKEGFVEVIASYMKLAYKTWNKEHFVSDDIVKDDLEILSEGQLELHEGHNSLDTLAMHASRKDKELQQMHQQRTGRGRRAGSAGPKKERKRGGGGNLGGSGGGGGSRRRKR